MLQNATGECKDALGSLRKALVQFEDVARQDSSREDWNRRNASVCYGILGDIQSGCGRLDEARTCYHKARVIQERFVRQIRSALSYPSNTDCLDRLAETDDGTGWLHHLGGRPDQAHHFLQQAQQRRKQLVDTDPAHIRWRHNLARTDLRLAILYHSLRQRDKARSTLQQVYSAIAPLVRENPEVTMFQRTLAEVHVHLGTLQHEDSRHPEAHRHFEQARMISETLLRDNPSVTQTRVILAESYTGTSRVLRGQGKHAKALHALQKGKVVWQKLVNDHPDIPRFRSGLADARSELARLQAEKALPAGVSRTNGASSGRR
jgi:tetratricopeptide (TPR) repeat protein